MPIISLPLRILLKNKKGCRPFYDVLYKLKSPHRMKCFVKWETELNFPNSHDDYSCFSLIYDCTEDNKLREFQFKILYRILNTNSFLFRIKLRNDSNCSFCKRHPETIKHLFTECEITKIIFNECYRWLSQFIPNFSLSDYEIICGYKGNTVN